jgi:hypothetical protein
VSAPRLRVATSASGEVVLTGVIDEHARLLEQVQLAPRLVLDLGGVTFINSLGVRDWIRLLARAIEARVHLELVRVSEPLVQQLNMIIATRAGVVVRSFFAPFACDRCGREDSVCLEVEPHRAALRAQRAPAIACPDCGAEMAFNDFPERYFSFLADEPAPGPAR